MMPNNIRKIAIGGGSLLSLLVVAVGMATDGFGLILDRDSQIKADASRTARIEVTIEAMKRELSQVREENNQADKNAKAIDNLEKLLRNSSTESVSNAVLQVAMLKSRLKKIETRLSELGTVPANDLKRRLASMVKAEIGQQLSETTASSGSSRQAQVIAKRLVDSDDSIQKNGLLWQFQRCYTDDRYTFCKTTVTNVTKKDIKACVSEAEIITDKGYQTTRPRTVQIGQKSQGYGTNVCSVIPPLVTVNSYVKADLRKRYEAELTLLRFNCGAGCRLTLYNIPVGQ